MILQPTPIVRGVLGRRRFLQLCAGSLALAASGCHRRNDRARASGTVIVGVPGQAALNPTPNLSDPIWLAFLPLMAFNAKGEMEGRLAERWEHSPDYKEWTYYLRPGVRWHDGVPVTAHDVKFTLELMNGPDVMEFRGLEAVTVLDNLTVRVRHPNYFRYQWEKLQYPKHLLEHLDTKQFWNWDFWKHPVGNGPYRFVSSQRPTTMEFDANPNYYAGKPKIERVLLKFLGEAGLADLMAGEVDAISVSNPGWIPTLAADPRIRLYRSIGSASVMLCWQHRDPLFRDARVRRALTLAIDRRELLQLFHFPSNAPLTDGPASDGQLRRGHLEEPLPHDPAQARELLEAAGWHDHDGDGVREREGLPFRFTALVPGLPGATKIAVYVREQFRHVGVEMAVQRQEDVHSRVVRGEFQAALDGVGVAGLYNAMGLGDHPMDGLGYHNARVVELIKRDRATADPNVKDQIYAELRQIFRNDVPVTYITPFWLTTAASKRIRGLSAPWRIDPLMFMDELSLDDSRSK